MDVEVGRCSAQSTRQIGIVGRELIGWGLGEWLVLLPWHDDCGAVVSDAEFSSRSQGWLESAGDDPWRKDLRATLSFLTSDGASLSDMRMRVFLLRNCQSSWWGCICLTVV